MAIQGLQSTDQFGGTLGSPDTIPAFERPTNWRQGVLMRYPNGHAPITALTSVMKKKVTDDPQFQWWEREVSNVRLELAADLPLNTDPVALTLVADPFGFGGGFQCKVGDLLYVENSGEILMVTVVTSQTSITVSRDWGAALGSKPLVDFDGANVNPYLLIMGNVNEEGAGTPESIRYRPTKLYNYTQIFRDSLKATRTAMQTRLRTVDEVRDAKTQCLLYHSIRQEYSFILGARYEHAGANGYPERSTGGILSFVPAANKVNVSGGALDMATFEAYCLEIFRFGATEKMAFVGQRAMMAFQQMARLNAHLDITPMTKEFGMDVRRFFTPNGTLVLKIHPLFSQITSQIAGGDTFYAMDSWALILDMGNITYRPLRGSDTQYLPDRQDNGVDGLTSEYLTECGLEVAHGKTHYLLKGLATGAAD